MDNSLKTLSEETPPDPSLENEDSRQSSGFFRFLVDLLETLVLSLLLFLGINTISARIRVDGSSMEPSLQSGEFVIVNRLAYKLGSPEIGDVVVFHFPGDPGQEYIKRIIGLAGDTVMVNDGQVLINGQPLDEPYIAATPRYNGKWEVPIDHIFVLGDNRNNSSDSHNWGAVPMENVVGEAFFVYWPPTDWGKLSYNQSASAASYP
jgi:signal peptidase I